MPVGFGIDGDRPDPELLARANDAERDLAPVVARAREVGTDVKLAVFPDLSRSFAASASKPLPAYKPVWPFAEAHGLTWLRVDLALQDQDVAALRLDGFRRRCRVSFDLHEQRIALKFAFDKFLELDV